MTLNHVTVRGCENDKRLAGLQSNDTDIHTGRGGKDYTIVLTLLLAEYSFHELEMRREKMTLKNSPTLSSHMVKHSNCIYTMYGGRSPH